MPSSDPPVPGATCSPPVVGVVVAGVAGSDEALTASAVFCDALDTGSFPGPPLLAILAIFCALTSEAVVPVPTVPPCDAAGFAVAIDPAVCSPPIPTPDTPLLTAESVPPPIAVGLVVAVGSSAVDVVPKLVSPAVPDVDATGVVVCDAAINPPLLVGVAPTDPAVPEPAADPAAMLVDP